MPRRNYGFEKRQKEVHKQQKREEKRQRKLDRATERENRLSSDDRPIPPAEEREAG